MRLTPLLAGFAIVSLLVFSGATRKSQEPAEAAKRQVLDSYGKLPLSFVPNLGQVDQKVRYYGQGPGFAFHFTPAEARLTFVKEKKGLALALRFVGARSGVRLEGERPLPGRVNYLTGRDQAKWRTDLPTYGEVVYRGLWPGIDLRVRGEDGQLKYEFHLDPGARVEDIELAYAGSEGLSVGLKGELRIDTALGVVEDAAPLSYQLDGGRRLPVESRYVLAGRGRRARYGFALASAYDPGRPLVIDPALAYSGFWRSNGASWFETCPGSPDGS